MSLASRIERLKGKIKVLTPVIDNSDLCWSGCGECKGCKETEEITLLQSKAEDGLISWDNYESLMEERALIKYIDPDGLEW